MSRWWIGIFLTFFTIFSLVGGYWYVSNHQSPAASVALEPPLALVKPTLKPTTKLLFVGDMMFDRNIRKAATQQSNDFVLASVDSLLNTHDFVIANLEGPITSNPSRSLGSVPGSANNFSFTFDPSWATTLYKHNIRIVNLGNNHILNFGVEGLEETLDLLAKNHVAYFGYAGVETQYPLSASYILEHQGQRFGFLNYNQFAVGSEPVALNEIKKLRSQVDWLIAYTHWDNEYQSLASNVTVALAHQFIDLGADLVIGSHPHVIQNHEVYKGKHIYYSLGNFVFDQYFEPAVKLGLAVSVEFKPGSRELVITETPTYLLKTGQTSLTEAD